MLPGSLFLSFALLLSDFGQSAVWRPPPNFRNTVLAACSDAGPGFGECLARRMKLAGASADALVFTRLIHNDGYIEAFRAVSRVSVAEVLYPFRANENYGNFLVNGQPPAIDIDNQVALPVPAMKEDASYKKVLAEHPKASLWPGDRSTPDTVLAVLLTSGGQEFIADYRVQDGCHACAILGEAFFTFRFAPDGKFEGVHFAGFTPHYSLSRLLSRKIVVVKPSIVFTIVLPAPHADSDRWKLAPFAKGSRLRALGHKLQPGSQDNELWTFRAPSNGAAVLNFAYSPTAQSMEDAVRRISITVRIQ